MASSIHIEKVTSGSFLHNDRTMKVSYLIDDSSLNECSTNSSEAIKKFQELKSEAIKNYTKRTKQKIQKSTIFLKEAIVNLEAHHTLEDLEPIKEKLESYGFKVLQMSIHRDEGFVNSENKKEKNYHAHITMFNLDTATGKTVKFGKSYKTELSRLQTFVANTLEMERGSVSVVEEAKRLGTEVSKPKKRLDTHEYKQAMKLKEKEVESLRYDYRAMQKRITELEELSNEQKRELHRLNSKVKNKKATIEDLEERLESLSASKSAVVEQNEAYNRDIERLQEEKLCNTLKKSELKEEYYDFYLENIDDTNPEEERITHEEASVFFGMIGKKYYELFSEAQETIKQHETTIDTQKSDLERYKQDMRRLRVQLEQKPKEIIKEVEVEVEKLHPTLEYKNGSPATYVDACNHFEKQLSEARETILSQKTTIDTQKSDLERYEQDMSVLEHKNKELDSTVTQLRSKNASLQRQHTSLLNAERSDRESDEKLQHTERKVKALQRENAELREENGILKDSIKSIAKIFNIDLKDAISRIASKIQEQVIKLIDERPQFHFNESNKHKYTQEDLDAFMKAAKESEKEKKQSSYKLKF